MSDELFEVAFSGQVRDGADPEKVKVNVGNMFKADEAKIAQMFSGRRVFIKKNLDKAAALKYANAFKKAGAKCEVKSMSDSTPSSPSPEKVEAAEKTPPAQEKVVPKTLDVDYTTTQNMEATVAPPPQVDPLGISGDQIEELSATMAPVGSELQDEIKEIPEPDIDITIFEVAPVGSDIGSKKKGEAPPPPDTTGMKTIEP
jgi:hypothetical protein